MEKLLDASGLSMQLDPVAEWRQIFNDAWRLERDYFYDPNMHGVDWEEMRKRYGALLDDVVTRWDLNFLIGELIAELNASHAYRGGGDAEQRRTALRVGLLGCDFELDDGAYRIARIIRRRRVGQRAFARRWPSPASRSTRATTCWPSTASPLDTTKDPWAAFQGLAGKTVELTVNDKPTTEGRAQGAGRDALRSEYRLRNLAWIEANRRKVDEATGGRVGYIYVPDTGRSAARPSWCACSRASTPRTG